MHHDHVRAFGEGGVDDAVQNRNIALCAAPANHEVPAAYATEHLEIASYQLLERIAQEAGDEETAEAARENRKDEEAMAKKLDAHWDKFAQLSLKEEGVPA